MAVIKIFDSKGVKTLDMLANANEQEYDPEVEQLEDEEQDDNPFA